MRTLANTLGLAASLIAVVAPPAAAAHLRSGVIAGDFRAHQQHSLPVYFALQTAHDGLSNVFPGNDVNLRAAPLDRFLRSGADGGDAESRALRSWK